MSKHSSHGPETANAPRRASVAPRLRALLLITTTLSVAPTAPAWASEWRNSGVGDWFDPANWDGHVVPGPFSWFEIDNGGTAQVTNGDHARPDYGVIGVSPGGSGAVDVTGPGSTLTTLGDVSVGYNGRGTLTVSHGATVSSSGGYSLGTQSGSTGLVIVTGTGSSLSITGDLDVGFGGTGSLDISDGATVSSGRSSIGSLSSGTGVATVTDAVSRWTNSDLIVGEDGNGTLTIGNGGTVHTTNNGTVGGNSDGVGVVTVDGAGSKWLLDNDLYVGAAGEGTLNVSNGGSVEADYGYIGENGTGTLNIASGGSVSLNGASIGNNRNGTGVVSVDGAGSTLTVNNDLSIGNSGNGTLRVSSGGSVSVGYGYIGNDTGSIGLVTVTGAGSSLSSSELYAGYNGTGTLEISDGGAVTSGYSGIGYYGGSTGVVTVSGAGSTWSNAGGDQFLVGQLGHGTLTITDGGAVHTTGDAYVGGDITGVGVVTVDGPGSTWSGIANHPGSSIANLTVGADGSGTLNITNGGHVTSNEAHIGEGTGNGVGSVVVDGAGSTWTNYDHMHLGSGGTGTLTISNGGVVDNGDDLNIGAGGTLNIGAAYGAPAAAAGTLYADQIIFDGGDAALVFNHTDPEYDFSLRLSGTGTIYQKGPGATVLTGDGSNFTGDTYVDGGTLFIDRPGTLAGTTHVGGILAGTTYVPATLGGTGTIGETRILGGGTIAPGHNSVDTLRVHGDLSFDADGTYAAQVEGGTSDLIAVTTGAADLAGARLTLSGHPTLLNTYTILTSDNGIIDTFGTVTADYAFITPSLSYDNDSVDVEFARNGIAFADIAASPNEASVAAAVEALGAGDTLYDAVLGLSETEAKSAFDQLAGEPSTQSADIQTAGLVSNILTGRIDQAFDAVGDGDTRVNNYVASGPGVVTDPASPTSGVWGQFYGAYGSVASSGGVAGSQSLTGGLAMGLDGQLGTWRVGVVVQGGATSSAVPDLNATSTSADYGAGLYAGTEFGDTRLALGATYTRHSISSSRHVVFPGVDETLTGSYASGTAQGFAQVSHEFDFGATSLTPYASLQYVANGSDGYTETGGAAALTVAPNLIDATFTTLGFSASQQFVVGDDKLLTAEGGIGWRHGFAGTPSSVRTLAGGTSFTVLGAPIASDIAVLNAGLNLDISDTTTFNLSYDGQLGAGMQTHGLKATWNSKF